MVEVRFKPGAVPDGSITEAKLADGAVTHPKVAVDAIERENIKDGEVLEVKVPPKVFVRSDALTGDKKVLSMGYDTVTEEIVLDRDA